jgi:hypothetical protein
MISLERETLWPPSSSSCDGDDGALNHHCGLCAMTEEDCGNYYYLFDYYCYCCKYDSSD